MSLQNNSVKQCCVSSPVWIFIYSDGRIFAICEKDFKSPSYQIRVEEIINIKTHESFTPQQMFGVEQN